MLRDLDISVDYTLKKEVIFHCNRLGPIFFHLDGIGTLSNSDAFMRSK